MTRIPFTRPRGFQPVGIPGSDAPMAIFLPNNWDTYYGVTDDDINRWLYGPQTRYQLQRDAPGSATAEAVRARVDFYGGLCWICRTVPAETIDHVKPLVKGGSNWPANLRPACRSCNSRKRDRWPFTPAVSRV